MREETKAGLWALLAFCLLLAPFLIQMVTGECPAFLWRACLGGGVGCFAGAIGALMKPKNDGR